MKKHYWIGMLITAMFFYCGSAVALDTDACNSFPHDWGENVFCEGKFEPSDMGTWVNDVWQWDPAFQNLLNAADFSGWNRSWADMTPQANTEVNVQYARFDNKVYPGGREPDSRVVFKGQQGGTFYPAVWKMRVEDPTGVDNPWFSHLDGSYPYYITHVDWIMNPVCQQLCGDYGCPFDMPGSQDLGTDGVTICSFDPPYFDDLYAGVVKELHGARQITMADVVVATLNGESVTPRSTEGGEYLYMKYDTGNNYLFEAYHEAAYGDEIYFHHFAGHAPVGLHTVNIELAGGAIVPLEFNVASSRAMPTVSRYIDGLEFTKVKLNKKGDLKLKDKTRDITVVNLKVRELGDQLIIQWVAPDGAYQAPEPGTGGIRLRIFVGAGWTSQDVNHQLTYLWIDAPVQCSNIVVPAEQWAWIKQKMADLGRTTVEVAGMYREQSFHDVGIRTDFHNRGYIESVEFEIPVAD